MPRLGRFLIFVKFEPDFLTDTFLTSGPVLYIRFESICCVTGQVDAACRRQQQTAIVADATTAPTIPTIFSTGATAAAIGQALIEAALVTMGYYSNKYYYSYNFFTLN